MRLQNVSKVTRVLELALDVIEKRDVRPPKVVQASGKRKSVRDYVERSIKRTSTIDGSKATHPFQYHKAVDKYRVLP